MTHNEWKDKWLNRIIDFDNRFGGQCVDVVRQYAKDVHGVVNIEGVQGAHEFFTRYEQMPNLKAAYFRITYQEGLEIPQGALSVWGATPNNSFGHAAIADSSTQTGMTVLEQDGFDNPQRNVQLGDMDGLEKRTTNYNNVLGWLVLKQGREIVSAVGMLPPANARIAASDRNAQNGDYWFNPSTLRWMLLTSGRWSNI